MAISRDVWQIISILEEEGFGAIAGDLLSEISRGRETEKFKQPGFQDGIDDQTSVVVRLPISEENQLREAISFLRLRLVEPVRALAKAERMASDLADVPNTRIRFIDPVDGYEVGPLHHGAGDAEVAEQLDALLDRLTDLIEPPAPSGA